jgi:hypothetical protein
MIKNDVWFLLLLRSCRRGSNRHCHRRRQQAERDSLDQTHGLAPRDHLKRAGSRRPIAFARIEIMDDQRPLDDSERAVVFNKEGTE